MEGRGHGTMVGCSIGWPRKAAYKRLSEETRRSYDTAKTALLCRFEPESKSSLNAAEFRACCKLSSEDWAMFADDIKLLADKAHPDLDAAALAVDRFLGQISDPQLSYSVRQTQPVTTDDAVAAMLELRTHFKLTNGSM